jgi:phosphomevalonate kinase
VKARAPGKIVMSGAYAVLDGAPAIVTAVDRYVLADAGRPPAFLTPEVAEAIGDATAPWFDASALRDQDRKLGLGSSAAILVASLAALELAARGSATDEQLCDAVLSRALAAHARAQGGGSGIDVATSTYGGTLLLTRHGETLEARRTALPRSLHVEVWGTLEPASTPALIGKVKRLKSDDPDQYARLMRAQELASKQAASAIEQGNAADFVEALAAQRRALFQLGRASGAPIVSDAVCELAELAAREAATVLPSGAGGGDIALYVGARPPSIALTDRARQLEHRPLALGLEARGVHAVT